MIFYFHKSLGLHGQNVVHILYFSAFNFASIQFFFCIEFKQVLENYNWIASKVLGILCNNFPYFTEEWSHLVITFHISHRNGLIYFPDFCTLCLEKFRQSDEEEEEFYKNAFKLFCGTEPFPTDFRAKKYKLHKNFITKLDFHHIMKSLPVPVTDEEIEEMFSFADKNKDGKLSYAEFEVKLNFIFVCSLSIKRSLYFEAIMLQVIWPLLSILLVLITNEAWKWYRYFPYFLDNDKTPDTSRDREAPHHRYWNAPSTIQSAGHQQAGDAV